MHTGSFIRSACIADLCLTFTYYLNKNHCAWVVRFSAAIPKDKPNQSMNALTLKTAQVSSLSCLSPNLRTTQQALVAEKSSTEKQRLQR